VKRLVPNDDLEQTSTMEITIGLVGGLFLVALLYFVVRWGVRDGMIDFEKRTRENVSRSDPRP
jgi:hypothetical protein